MRFRKNCNATRIQEQQIQTHLANCSANPERKSSNLRGQITELCGLKGQARLVGYALHNLPEKTKIPWHRVINAKAYKTLTSSRKKDQLYTAFYNYEDHSGTKVASIALNIPERNVIKTIFLETDKKQPLIVLMHGDCEFSTKNLACLLGIKHVGPCDLKTAEKHTGYIFGGTSPFGTRKQLPVYINGDKHCISDYKS